LSREPRIDAYITKAQPFARPILKHVRERVHALVPDVEEAMKWSHPTYCRGGKIILGTAAFKEHAAVNFWRGQELGFDARSGAMGQLGKLTKVEDLPPNFEELVAKAAALSDAPPPRKRKHEPKPPPEMHPEFAAALAKAPKAKATFDAFAPSCRREYVEWVAEAKRDETRTKRIASAIEWLSEGKKRNWKYETC
jgi:uncharacterized protein YdeI (YjbR/CyaY-like superfamily)